MNGNLAMALARRAERFGWLDRPLFRTATAIYSHGAVHGLAGRASGVLAGAGVRRGQRVLVAVPDSVELAAALLGTVRLGAVAVLAGPEQTAAQHTYVLHDASPSLVVCAPELADRFPGVQVLAPGDLADPPAVIPEAADTDPDEAAYVQYTSGSTGSPKGVVHRHSDARAYVEALALGALGLGPEDVVLSAAKACYPFGLGNSVLFPMHAGSSAVLWPGPTGGAELAAVAARHRPTLLFGTPVHYAALLSADPDAFGSLRAAVVAGEPLLPALADRVEEFLGCPLLDGLGSTEVGHTFVSNTITRRRRGTLGVPLPPYEIRVRTGNGRPAERGERGLLEVRGPSVMLEYLGRPVQTAEMLSADGWLATGDLVHVDREGFVHHHGRSADLELVGGVPVAPLEAERVLGEHPAIAEIAVVGDGTGVLRAFASVLPGHAPDFELATELREHARIRLRAMATPAEITFLAALPRTAAGKVDREALRGPATRRCPAEGRRLGL